MKQGHRSNHRRRKPRNIVLTAFCVALVAILLGMGVYVAQWYLNLGRIRAEGERYARMYGGRETAPRAAIQPVATLPTDSRQRRLARPTPFPPRTTPIPTKRPHRHPRACLPPGRTPICRWRWTSPFL